MSQKDKIVAEIEQLLSDATDAVVLSKKLFSPGGLFSLLASTENERKALVESDLFNRAQDRLSDLQFHEATEFEQAHPMPDFPARQIGLVTSFTPDLRIPGEGVK